MVTTSTLIEIKLLDSMEEFNKGIFLSLEGSGKDFPEVIFKQRPEGVGFDQGDRIVSQAQYGTEHVQRP